ncbi:MAG: hypothetical protein JEZ08_24865 [Clostridiales bacterium]|nr:hypothetical protein [Clostridiales bacterium]
MDTNIINVTDKYQINVDKCKYFTNKIHALLQELLSSQNIDYLVVESRTKDIKSIKEKLDRKKYKDPEKEMLDIIGIRVILFYQKDLSKIEKLISDEFIIDLDNSMKKKDAYKESEFGYLSDHYICKLNGKRLALTEWCNYSDMHFELQVRTVLQHSWAVLSHKTEYKKDYEVPRELKRKLFRLASLIELADEEYMAIIDKNDELKANSKTVKSGDDEFHNTEEINLLTLINYIESAQVLNEIADIATNNKFEIRNLDKTYHDKIIKYCNAASIKTIKELNTFLEDSKLWANDFFKNIVLYSKWEIDYAFMIYMLLIYRCKNNISVDTLKNDGWEADFADRFYKKILKVTIDI